MWLSKVFAVLLLRNVANLVDPVCADQSIISSQPWSNSPLLELHRSLIENESITGNEQQVSQLLVTYLEDLGFTVEIQLVKLETALSRRRENIFAYLGTNRASKVLVTSHIDTVPPYLPYKRIHDEIWGRGSVDAKGSVASQIIAVEELISAGRIKTGDVALLFVVGEEVGGDGMKKANDLNLKWDAVIFGEPTELKLASGHKGIIGVEISATGKAGHSGYPQLGRNANDMLVDALFALRRKSLPWSEKYGNTTLNIGKIEGGVAANVIAERSNAKIAIRVAGGSIEALKETILNTVYQVDKDFDVVFSQGYGPIYIDSDVEVNYGTDIPNLDGDHKRYLYGPGSILMAHSDHEHIKVSDLETAVKGYKILIEKSLIRHS